MSTEASDNLQSKAVLTLLDLLGEGEIGGLVEGLKSVYLNDTPIQNADGTFNFQGVTGAWANGTNDQAPLPNFGNFSESPFTAGVQVKQATPYTFTISSPVADAVRVIINFPSLSYTDPSNGDITGTTVQYKFSRSIDNGPFVDIGTGSEWMEGGTITAGPPASATATSGATGVRATLGMTFNGGTSVTTNGITNIPTPDTIVVQAQEFDGTSWQNLGGEKTMRAEWVSTGDFQSGGSDGDRFYTYALVTDSYVVESAYNQVRFNVVTASASTGVVITKVESKLGQSVVTVSGKSRSRYQRAHVLPIPRPATNVRFRVTRITNDATTAYLANETWVDSYAEIVTLNMRYPNSALFGLRVDSQQFNSIPNRSFLVDGLKIQVPTNYNPVSRTYSGAWDGTFKRAVTSNPAWILYDLLTNTRYGLGEFVPSYRVDKAMLYTIGRYCDEMVPDGTGGMEPRFTLNTVIGSQGEAYKLISDITSVFRGMGYWDGGMVKFTQDAPSDPVMMYTPANVVDGSFTYTGSARKDRHSVVHVTWNDPEDNYKKKVEYVEDAELIAKYGIKKLDTLAFGCTSRGEAARVGRWILYTERYESDFITFKVGLDAALVAPGDIIKIHDVMRAGSRVAGRLKACTSTQATLDAPVEITATPATISLMMPDGSMVQKELTNGVGTHTVVNFVGSLTTLPVDNAVYLISEANIEPVLARVVAITQDGTGGATFEITAVESDPGKYSLIETGLKLETRKTSILDPNFVETPSNLTVVENTYTPAPGVLASKLVLSWFGNSTTYEVAWRGVSESNRSNWQQTTLSNQLVFDVLNVVPGTYEFSIVGINPLGVRSKTVYTSYAVQGKTVPPNNVSGFNAFESNGGLVLSWTANSDVDLKGYEIRQSATVGDTWETATRVAIVSGVSTNYSIGVIRDGTAYEWQIRAIDTSDNYSTTAARVSYTKTAVTGTTASFAYVNGALTLNWAATSGTAAYWRVKRGATWASATVVSSKTTDTTLVVPVTWTSGQTFWIAPVDALNNEGTPTSLAVTFDLPSTPTVSAAQQSNNLLISWTASTGSLPIDSYEILTGPTLGAATTLATISGTQYSARITWLDTRYIYVRAKDSNGNVGSAGSVQYVPQAPATPAGASAAATVATVILSWTMPSYVGHDYTEVWAATTDSLAAATLIGTTNTSMFNHALGETGVTRYYWLRNIDQLGTASGYSSSVSATTGKVGNTDLTDLAITASKLADGSLTLAKFASGLEPVRISASLPTTKTTELLSYEGSLYRWDTTTSAYVKMNATVNATDIQGQITDAQIAGLAASKLSGTITSTQITDGAISTPKLAAGAITSAKIAAGTIQASNIAAGTITGDRIAANTLTGDLIVASAIASDKIAAGAISTDKIAANAITSDLIAANAITAAKIAAGAISAGSAIISNAAITTAKIADAAITTAKIADASIDNAKIANASITSAKIDTASFGSLSAISANLGTITAGDLSIGTNPAIDGSVMTGSGVHLYSDGKVVFGNSTSSVVWNGSQLTINGTVIATGNISSNAVSTTNQLVGTGGGVDLWPANSQSLTFYSQTATITNFQAGKPMFVWLTAQLNLQSTTALNPAPPLSALITYQLQSNINGAGWQSFGIPAYLFVQAQQATAVTGYNRLFQSSAAIAQLLTPTVSTTSIQFRVAATYVAYGNTTGGSTGYWCGQDTSYFPPGGYGTVYNALNAMEITTIQMKV